MFGRIPVSVRNVMAQSAVVCRPSVCRPLIRSLTSVSTPLRAPVSTHWRIKTCPHRFRRVPHAHHYSSVWSRFMSTTNKGAAVVNDISDLDPIDENGKKWISDRDGVLSDTDWKQLNDRMSKLNKDEKRVVMYVMKDLKGLPAMPQCREELASFTKRLHEYSFVDPSKGVVLAFFNTQRGAQLRGGHLISDDDVDKIMHGHMIPKFKQGNVKGGLLAAIDEFERVLPNSKDSGYKSDFVPPPFTTFADSSSSASKIAASVPNESTTNDGAGGAGSSPNPSPLSWWGSVKRWCSDQWRYFKAWNKDMLSGKRGLVATGAYTGAVGLTIYYLWQGVKWCFWATIMLVAAYKLYKFVRKVYWPYEDKDNEKAAIEKEGHEKKAKDAQEKQATEAHNARSRHIDVEKKERIDSVASTPVKPTLVAPPSTTTVMHSSHPTESRRPMYNPAEYEPPETGFYRVSHPNGSWSWTPMHVNYDVPTPVTVTPMTVTPVTTSAESSKPMMSGPQKAAAYGAAVGIANADRLKHKEEMQKKEAAERQQREAAATAERRRLIERQEREREEERERQHRQERQRASRTLSSSSSSSGSGWGGGGSSSGGGWGGGGSSSGAGWGGGGSSSGGGWTSGSSGGSSSGSSSGGGW